MDLAEAIAVASVCVAGLALVHSWLAGRKASRAMREANDLAKQNVAIQERLAQVEQSREHARLTQSRQAALRPELRPTERGGQRLFIANTGQAEARNVTVKLDGAAVLEHPAVSSSEPEKKLVGAGAEVSYLLATSRGKPPPSEFEATWEDDSGERGYYRTPLSRL